MCGEQSHAARVCSDCVWHDGAPQERVGSSDPLLLVLVASLLPEYVASMRENHQ